MQKWKLSLKKIFMVFVTLQGNEYEYQNHISYEHIELWNRQGKITKVGSAGCSWWATTLSFSGSVDGYFFKLDIDSKLDI